MSVEKRMRALLVSYYVMMSGVCLSDVCVFNCDLMCRGVWSVVCVVLCLCVFVCVV